MAQQARQIFSCIRACTTRIPKTSVMRWEPAVSSRSFSFDFSISPNEAISAPDLDIPWITTLSAFDPGATRPLLLSSEASPPTSSLIPSPLPILSSKTLAITEKKEAKLEVIGIIKPWPYSLPMFLQPKEGTTFAFMYGGSGGEKKGNVGILQAVLYGVPEPGVRMMKEGILWKVLYGVKEDKVVDRVVDSEEVEKVKK